jgi:hypothetical protein
MIKINSTRETYICISGTFTQISVQKNQAVQNEVSLNEQQNMAMGYRNG